MIGKYRDVKASVRVWQKVTGLAGEIHELTRHSRVAEVNRWLGFLIDVNTTTT